MKRRGRPDADASGLRFFNGKLLDGIGLIGVAVHVLPGEHHTAYPLRDRVIEHLFWYRKGGAALVENFVKSLNNHKILRWDASSHTICSIVSATVQKGVVACRKSGMSGNVRRRGINGT